ncbi:uncharacterized protein VP01_5316g1 [Puccinia sorghi]|uniref:Uncharacterized protein n=1 Tax=Puccinia sorghi TaxID=27349 RepID=A0A0L6UK86_9BASI|nr:uncharacterized protein VP01_5316g1 [Puccinia sorghi]
MAGQQNPAPAPSPNTMVLAKPQPFDGTCGTAAKAFVGQIGLHAVTYPAHFPTNASKVAFPVSFMKDSAEIWSQPYLDKGNGPVHIPEGPKKPTLRRQAIPSGPEEPLFPLRPGRQPIRQMFEWGSENPRPPTNPIFYLDLVKACSWRGGWFWVSGEWVFLSEYVDCRMRSHPRLPGCGILSSESGHLWQA